MRAVTVKKSQLEQLREILFEIDSVVSVLDHDLDRKVELVNLAVVSIDSMLMVRPSWIDRLAVWIFGEEDGEDEPSPSVMRRLSEIKDGVLPCVSK